MSRRLKLSHSEEITIQDLYPDLTPEQQEEAEYYLKRYMDIIWHIYERTRGLTASSKAATLQDGEGK